MLKIGVR